jgi:hypothetical protein
MRKSIEQRRFQLLILPSSFRAVRCLLCAGTLDRYRYQLNNGLQRDLGKNDLASEA